MSKVLLPLEQDLRPFREKVLNLNFETILLTADNEGPNGSQWADVEVKLHNLDTDVHHRVKISIVTADRDELTLGERGRAATEDAVVLLQETLRLLKESGWEGLRAEQSKRRLKEDEDFKRQQQQFADGSWVPNLPG